MEHQNGDIWKVKMVTFGKSKWRLSERQNRDDSKMHAMNFEVVFNVSRRRLRLGPLLAACGLSCASPV